MSKDPASPWVPMLLSTGITLTAFAGITYFLTLQFQDKKQDLSISLNEDKHTLGSEEKDADPKDADPKDADSKDADSKDADPKDADPKDADSKDADPKDADPKDAKTNSNDSKKSNGDAPWSYEGKTGPDHWHEITEIAKTGIRQSPIDLVTKNTITPTKITAVEFNYQDSSFKLENNGHTIKVGCDPKKNSIQIGDHRYDLLEFHFHASSEHLIDGEKFPMEVQLVHVIGNNSNQEDNPTEENDVKPKSYAVVGILIKEGKANALISELWQDIPEANGPSIHWVIKGENVNALLPTGNRSYYRYNGSHTTPPCKENVLWTIMSEPIEFSKEQIETFTNLYKNNSRPVQKLHRRFVLKYQDSTEDSLITEPTTTPGGQSQPLGPGKPESAIPPLPKGEVGIHPTTIVVNPARSEPATIPLLTPTHVKPTLTVNE